MKKLRNTLLIVLLSVAALGSAQEVNTLFFLENAPMRHIVNPAFQPVSNGYVNFTPLGYMSLWAGNNSLTMRDLIYNYNGKTITALHPQGGDREALYNAFRKATLINTDMTLNILGFGFRYKENGYININITERIDAGTTLPRDLFRFGLRGGMRDLDGVNTFDLSQLGLHVTAYTEIAGGYSHKINEHWTGKARINYGDWINGDTARNDNNVMVDRIYVQGDYKNLSICLGKLPYRSKADYGMVTDGSFAGGSLIVGKKVKVALNLGRFNDSVNALGAFGDDAAASLPGHSIFSNRGEGTASYGSLEIYNDRDEAPFSYSEREKVFTWGLGWHHFRQRNEMDALIDRSDYDILALGLGYRFTRNLQLTGAYAHAFGVDAGPRLKAMNAAWESGQKNSYAIQLDYKGAHPGKKGSWGAFVAWRQLGGFSSTGWNTYKINYVQDSGTRGLELGVSWTPMLGFMTKLHWFHGQNMNVYSGEASTKVNTVFTELCFYF